MLVVPIIIGSIPNNLECYLEILDISCNVETLQKSVLLETGNILRTVLPIKQKLENIRKRGREREGY